MGGSAGAILGTAAALSRRPVRGGARPRRQMRRASSGATPPRRRRPPQLGRPRLRCNPDPRIERHVAWRRGLCLCACVLGGGDRARRFRRTPRRNALPSKIRAMTPRATIGPICAPQRRPLGHASGAMARPVSALRGSACKDSARKNAAIKMPRSIPRRRRRISTTPSPASSAALSAGGGHAVLRHAGQRRIFLRGRRRARARRSSRACRAAADGGAATARRQRAITAGIPASGNSIWACSAALPASAIRCCGKRRCWMAARRCPTF